MTLFIGFSIYTFSMQSCLSTMSSISTLSINAIFSIIKCRLDEYLRGNALTFLTTNKVSISSSNCLVGIVPPTLNWSLAPVRGHGRERVV